MAVSDEDRRAAAELAALIILNEAKGMVLIATENGESEMQQIVISNDMVATDIIGNLEIAKGRVVAVLVRPKDRPSSSWTDGIGEDEE